MNTAILRNAIPLSGILFSLICLLGNGDARAAGNITISTNITQKACSLSFTGSGVNVLSVDLGQLKSSDFDPDANNRTISPTTQITMTLGNCGIGSTLKPVIRLTGGSGNEKTAWQGILFRKSGPDGGTSDGYYVVVAKTPGPKYTVADLYQTCTYNNASNCTVYSGQQGDSGNTQSASVYLGVACIICLRPGTLNATIDFTASYL